MSTIALTFILSISTSRSSVAPFPTTVLTCVPLHVVEQLLFLEAKFSQVGHLIEKIRDCFQVYSEQILCC